MAHPPSSTPPQAPSRARIIFWSLLALSVLLKVQLATVLGTMDVVLYSRYGSTLARSNFAAAYASDPVYNIPPMVAGYSALLVTLFGPVSHWFAFFLKLPGIIAESVFGILLWRRYGHENSLRRWIGLLVVLNPISIPVTGMHGNFDGLLAVFIGMALLMAIDDRPIASGIWLGLAANLKVSPILLTPVFFFWWWHRGRMWSFTLTAAATILAGWSPGLIQCPKLFLERVLAYSSLWGTWGISRLFFLTGSPDYATVVYGAPSAPAQIISVVLKVIIVGATGALAWRRRKLDGIGLVGTVAAVWTIFFVFAPGGAAQYMVWPIFPLLLYNARIGIAYIVAATPFMLIFYPFAVISTLGFNPYRALAKIWPGMRASYAWTGPALFLWGTLIVILALECRRWWAGEKKEAAPVLLDAAPEAG